VGYLNKCWILLQDSNCNCNIIDYINYNGELLLLHVFNINSIYELSTSIDKTVEIQVTTLPSIADTENFHLKI